MVPDVDLNSPDSHVDEKKLWLDYLAKLRDREDRSNQVTGITNWVLYGLMGTLFYKAFGVFPVAFSDRGYRYNTYLFVILGLNSLIFGQLVFNEFLLKVKDETIDIRALPAGEQSFFSRYLGLFASIAVLLGLIELWLRYQNPSLSRTVRYSLLTFGLFHSFLGFAAGLSFYLKSQLDRLQQGLFPQFRGGNLKGGRTADIFMLFAFIASSASIVLQVRDSMRNASTWLLSIQSAFGILIFLWAAYKLIVLRPSRDQFIDAIASLEQQALVEKLSASAIRERFVSLTSGIRLSDWLEKSSESITKVWDNIGAFLNATSNEVKKICSLPPTPEKLQILRETKQKISTDTTGYDKPFAITSVQIGAGVVVNFLLNRITFKEAIDQFKKFKQDADSFNARLKGLFKQLDDELIRTEAQLKCESLPKTFSATD